MDSNASYFSSGQVFSPASASYPAQPSSKTFPRKPLIICIILAVLVIVVIILALVFGGKTVFQGDLKSALNNYSNYLLYGTNSNESLPEGYSRQKSYYLEQVIFGDIENVNKTDFLKEANSRLQAFIDKYAAEKGTDLIDYGNLLSYQELLSFIKTYTITGKLKDEDILAAYLSEGTSKTLSFIDSKYAPYINSDSSYAKEYGEEGVTYGKALVKAYDIVGPTGCLSNSGLAESCSLDSEKSSMVREIENELSSLKYFNDSNYTTEMIMQLESMCWKLYEFIGEEE
ncbi:hypothetical protein IJF86_00570 [Candidatus Saccharibacteria bacterium]|nr:hypothetical protein [Candidatus Saccharibacteria bacterium]